MRRIVTVALLLTGVLVLAAPGRAADAVPADFRPDPFSVQRHGAGYRYPQAGWIVLHVEGEPYERGYQHGKLLAPEIAAYVRCLAALASAKAPDDGWTLTRQTVNALFLRRFDKEYLEEMKGIADGASAAGARFDKRPIDLLDVVSINAAAEMETLPSALEATPTGLESIRFPLGQPRATPPPKPMHCSAFAATGPATADGKIVFGHITMYGLYASLFYNVWLDVKPAKGRRVLMQTYPGGIQSGLDYYLNDAGMIVCETTIRQTRFEHQGMALASRIRQALQYSDSIDKVVETLQAGNNGLYTNEWLIADVKTNEIAMLELGTQKSRLRRSSKGEWFGGTEGFYWGCNNTKDLDVRLETVASTKGRPANVVWRPSARDQKWLQLYQRHKGKIDAGFGRLAFTTPPVAAYHSLDAKYTTSALAKELKTWALFGPPLEKTWKPTEEERDSYPEIRPLVSNPWVVLHPNAPPREAVELAAVHDLPEKLRDDDDDDDDDKEKEKHKHKKHHATPTEPAWHGTLLARSDADVWLAAAFADYETIVALDNARAKATEDAEKKRLHHEITLDLFAYRSGYRAGARASRDVPLNATRAELTQAHWYRVAAGKGVCLLQALRQALGDVSFADMMEAFGKGHGGKEVSTAEFQEHVESWAAKNARAINVPAFFTYWLKEPGLPRLQLQDVRLGAEGATQVVEGTILRENTTVPLSVEACVEFAKGEVKKTIALTSARTTFRIECEKAPVRLVVNRNGDPATANGSVYSILSFLQELEDTCIVYGTADERATNREAAEALQRALLEKGPNVTVPIKTDHEITDDDLKSHHLLLIGRPDSNRVVDRFRAALPVTFGSRSFKVGRAVYAHPGSAVLIAAESPLNARYSVVVIGGLSAESTLSAAPQLVHDGQRSCEVQLLAHGAKPRSMVLPARELVHEFEAKAKR